jgi:putative ABC transport system permease protein
MLFQDLRFGLRMLRRGPGFTAAAVITLALGTGATTAVFSVVNAVVLRQLPYPDASRVMTVLSVGESGEPYRPGDPSYVAWRDRLKCFDLFAGGFDGSSTLRGAGDPHKVTLARVSATFFPMAGVRPALGRFFSAGEDQEGRDPVAVLDYGVWRREFGGDPHVLGRLIDVAGQRTIIGVLPPGVYFPGSGPKDVWIPLVAPMRGGMWGAILAMGRLRPGVSPLAAQAELDALTRQLIREGGKYRVRRGVVKPLRDWIDHEVRGTFLVIMGAAAFLLLIACTNLANLMLARGTGRRREMAIRAAVGAGRWRLAAQCLTESVMLAAIGGALGMALAFAAVRAAPAIKAIEIPRAQEIAVDGGFFLIGLGVSLASGVLFGLAPAFQVWRRDLSASLHRGEAPAATMGGQGFRHALVAAQLALAMVLLSGAGLMTNTLVRLLNVDLGFEPSSIFSVDPGIYLRDRAANAGLMRGLAERVRRMPGVESVAVVNRTPLETSRGGYDLTYESAGGPRKCDAQSGADVDPGYFRTARIPLLAGRDFEPADAARKPVPVILNRPAARALFGGEEPLGKVVRCRDRRVGLMQVIGIVGDVRIRGLAEAPEPQAFAPLLGGWGWPSYLLARTNGELSALTPAIRAAVKAIDPSAPRPEIAPLDDALSEEVAKPRFYATLLGSFAALGLILAAVGIYGVISYAVARRRHEFGVRLALGAEPGDLVRLALGSGARVIAAGAVAGLAGAFAATRLLASLLYEVKPWDPATFAATGMLLVAVALFACWLAARRAATVDPNVALRCE